MLNKSKSPKMSFINNKLGFTIVELLVVIVVIGIVASITTVSYSGITNRAKIAEIELNLTNANMKLKSFKMSNGYYPTSISADCAAAPTTTTNLCLKPSNDNSSTTVTYSNPTPQTFVLTEAGGSNTYHITEKSTINTGVYVAPIPPDASLAVSDPANWIAIGTQVWAKYNLNVGTRIASTTNQTDNVGGNIVEKYCYGNTDSGCTNLDANGIPYGALYQWDEAMKYTATPNTDNQGICPAGSHIPTDNELKILEVQLGMTQVQADDVSAWRGADTYQGTQLKPGGTSGLNIPLAGYRSTGGSFLYLSTFSYLLSSSESNSNTWIRNLNTTQAGVYRGTNVKAGGYSVRCVGN